MNDKKEDKLLNSNYDGIEEYDNDLPRWWLYLFYGTIIFAVGYSIYYHLGGPGLSSAENLEIAMAELDSIKKAQQPKESTLDLMTLVKDTPRINAGSQVFSARCLPCHGAKGEGLVGPNLTDDHWLHGGKITEIKKVIEEGVLSKGMLSWKGQISDDEITNVTLYVWNLYGTNPPNAKAPEGIKVERES